MFINTLSSETLALVKRIRTEHLPPESYLAGGTALALQIGHRKSLDLDFFTETQFNEEQWQQKYEQEFNFDLIQKDWQTLGGVIEGVKFSTFYYKYPLIDKKEKFLSIELASLKDLSAMKLDTVIARGTKRDLIDIYFLAQKFTLPVMFEFYDQKFKKYEEREIMIKKALLYFEDAEKDEIPDMTLPFDWEKLKEFFLKEVHI
jgi:Nucleotidyl transferase AbiEii toxin, Type IV TA system